MNQLRHILMGSTFTTLLCFALFASEIATPAQSQAASPFDHLTDFTGKATVIVTLKGRDNFTSEYRYDVSVRNHTADLIMADSLIIVLDKITNLAGQDREGLTGESFLERFDVLGQDGETEDGKPFFRIPAGATPDLPPQTDSLPASVRIRNRDYLAVFTPSFRIFGQKRPSAEPKKIEAAVPAGPAPVSQPHSPPSRASVDKLLQLLLKKGVITEEEWRKANQP
ncbi:MAG: hypothetical protein Q8N04_00855 [Nitrospira sp.]|nr:hypothetical protein [Nitrospira sp.]